MIDLQADIISFTSIGNIHLNDNISHYMQYMYENFNVETKEYTIPFPFNETNVAYILNGIVSITTKEQGTIIGVGCNEKYKGKYNEKLYPGITMGDLLRLTGSQRILNGTLIIDEDYGLSFTLPAPYNEIADYLEDIPLDLKLNEIYVSDYSFWVP